MRSHAIVVLAPSLADDQPLLECREDLPVEQFASVLKVDQNDIPALLGPTLVVTAITKDPKLIQKLVTSSRIDRLNIGALPTNQISWDQPHEGNLFDHLYARRAFQQAVAV